MILSVLALVFSPLTYIVAGFIFKFYSLTQIFSGSTARIPVATNSMTYVLSLISKQLFSISITSFFDNACLSFFISLVVLLLT